MILAYQDFTKSPASAWEDRPSVGADDLSTHSFERVFNNWSMWTQLMATAHRY